MLSIYNPGLGGASEDPRNAKELPEHLTLQQDREVAARDELTVILVLPLSWKCNLNKNLNPSVGDQFQQGSRKPASLAQIPQLRTQESPQRLRNSLQYREDWTDLKEETRRLQDSYWREDTLHGETVTKQSSKETKVAYQYFGNGGNQIATSKHTSLQGRYCHNAEMYIKIRLALYKNRMYLKGDMSASILEGLWPDLLGKKTPPKMHRRWEKS